MQSDTPSLERELHDFHSLPLAKKEELVALALELCRCPETRRELCNLPGLYEALVAALETGQPAKIQKNAIWTVQYLAFSYANTQKMYECAGLVEALEREAKNGDCAATWSLHGLTSNPAVSEDIRANRASLVAVLQANPEDMYAKLALVNIFGAITGATELRVDEKLVKFVAVTLLDAVIEGGICNWELHHPLRAIRNLVVVDANAKLVLDQPNVIERLFCAADLGQDRDDPDVVYLVCTALSFLAYYDQASAKLKLNLPKLRAMLTDIDAKPQDAWEEAGCAVKALIWQLDPPALATQVDTPNGKARVMVSYQWDSQELAKKIDTYLCGAGYDVWIDVRRMKGDLNSAMADAVNQADAVLVIATQMYSRSANCKLECSLAVRLEKKVVPVTEAGDFRLRKDASWLGLLLGGKMYYTMINDSTFEAIMKDIIDKNFDCSTPAVVQPVAPRPPMPTDASAIRAYFSHAVTDGDKIADELIAQGWKDGDALIALWADRADLKSQLPGLDLGQLGKAKMALGALFG
jgi:hypothetical protein